MDPSVTDFTPAPAGYTYTMAPNVWYPATTMPVENKFHAVSRPPLSSNVAAARRPSRRPDSNAAVVGTPSLGPSPGGNRVSKTFGPGPSPNLPLTRRTTTAGTTSLRSRGSTAASYAPHLSHPSHRLRIGHQTPTGPTQAVRSDGDGWGTTVASRPITWHFSSTDANGQPPSWPQSNPYPPGQAPLNGWFMSTAPQPAPLASTRQGSLVRANEPPTPSLYPASEATSPTSMPYSPSLSNLGLNDLDLTQIYDPTTLDVGMSMCDGLPATWLPTTSKFDFSVPDHSSALRLTPSGVMNVGHLSAADATSSSSLQYAPWASSPDWANVLPTQHPDPVVTTTTTASTEDLAGPRSRDDDEKELVGMGLYDDVPSAAPMVSSALRRPIGRFGDMRLATNIPNPANMFDRPGPADTAITDPTNFDPRRTGKGLKLEETWAPPPPLPPSTITTTTTTAAEVLSTSSTSHPNSMSVPPIPANVLDPRSTMQRSFLLDDEDLLDANPSFSLGVFHGTTTTTLDPNLFAYI